jgi:hypothetical protein
MRLSGLTRAAIAFFSWWTALGQVPQALLSPPSIGLVFDSKAGALRRIEGNPGAASLGEAIPGGERLAIAAVLPDAEGAIGVDADSGAVVLISGGERRELPGAMAGPVAIRSAAGGRSAALIYADGVAQVFTGFPSAPELHWQLHIADGILSEEILASVSGDGNELMAADGATVKFWRRSGERSEVLLESRVSFAVLTGDGRALAVTGDGGALWVIQDGEAKLVAGSGQETVAAVLIGDRIGFVSGNGAISIARLDGERLGEWNCGCQPASLEAVNGKAVFRLTGPETGTVWMLDLGAALPRLFFAARNQVSDPEEVPQ